MTQGRHWTTQDGAHWQEAGYKEADTTGMVDGQLQGAKNTLTGRKVNKDKGKGPARDWLLIQDG